MELPALKPGDYIMEYRQVDANGVEEVKAKYFCAKDGKHVALAPAITFFENHQLMDNLDYWTKAIDGGSFKNMMTSDNEVAMRSLRGDLDMLRFVLMNLTPEKAESDRLAWEAHLLEEKRGK